MAKSISLSYLSFLLSPSRSPFPSKTSRLLSTTRTPFPLQYDLIINRPPPPSQTRPPSVRPNDSLCRSTTQPEPDDPEPTPPELGLHTWVDRKLGPQKTAQPELDKSKRKYYNKRRKRMYGSDSDDDGRGFDERMVELKPEVMEFLTLHRREEELYFYDAFTYPWEKEKHYKMVYQLEKKYFPDQCLDKAFLQPGQQSKPCDHNDNKNNKKKLVFFEGKVEEKKEKGGGDGDGGGGDGGIQDLTEKKVQEFFKGLKKAPNKDPQDGGEPIFSSRSTGLPPIWDGPHGTVLLVNKPKGQSRKSF